MSASVDLAPLFERRAAFISFLTSRLGGNRSEAEDLLQSSLAKALQNTGTLHDDTKLVAWFYQLLRNAIVDHVRARQADNKRVQTWAWTQEITHSEANEIKSQVCHCFEGLLPTLKPSQAELLRRVELQDETVNRAAAALGITSNNASVLLHRARKELRARLEAFCGPCADQACLDCDCGERPQP